MTLSRGEKKLALVCALALAIPLGIAAYFSHINATPIVAVAPIQKAPQPNGYDLYIQAANSIKRANPPVDAVLEFKTIEDPKVRAQRYSIERKEAWLKQNKAAFALFERAQQTRALAPPVTLVGRNSPGSSLRQMARYKVAESNAHWQRGDHNEALQSGLDIVQMGYDIQRGGGALDYVVGTSLNSMSRVTTGDAIEHLDAAQAKTAAKRVEDLLATRWTLEQALVENKRRVQQEWLTNFEKPGWRTSTLFYIHGPRTWQVRWRAQTITKRQIMLDIARLHQSVIPNASQPYGIAGAAPIALNDPFLSFDQKFIGSLRFNQARMLTTDRVLMLRLTLRAYQLEQGALPPNLKALVPAYISSVPTDPFGKGEPLRYRTDGQTYTLWSIGPDGVDDGGKPISWHNGAPKRYADQREKLPFIGYDKGDYVAGRNH